ncbi:MAG: chromosome segregation protein SMC [Calditrichaeota bacterium]|nr:chromosome segregation protein SMC [Calditrichota bacterium]MCB9366440.1 chromosome segregation protein SMC [Calditrichota bacterium]
MQLISLHISGFKSFAVETNIQFATGVTGVVGPNGCGKSNVVDALRWVLGEQRSSVLRGERMENVIFNGTVRRKPLNMAEVRVKFDNSSGRINLPYSEIEIARKLHRDGTSEYLINGNVCRLRDITDMLQDSGLGPNAYTILELKMIEDILREEGEGRRQLFEEASGIAKYKMRRRQALAKLGQTEEDLLRLADIISEVERQVASLKRQVSKAKRYQELSAELKQAETAFVVTEFYRIVDELTPMQQALAEASGKAEESTASLRNLESQVERLRSDQVDSDQQLGDLRKLLQETVASISMLEAEKAGAEARLIAARESLERAQRQTILARDKLQAVEARKMGLTEDFRAIEAETEVATKAKTEHSLRFEASQAALKDNEAAYKEKDGQLAALNRSQSELESNRAKHLESIARQKGRRESASHSLEQVKTERQELGRLATNAKQELEAATGRLEAASRQLEAAENEGPALRDKLAELQQKLQELERIEHAANSHIQLLKTLEQRGPRASSAIKVAREALHGTSLVADHALVEPKYRKALHVALGQSAYHLIISDADELRKAVVALSSREEGRCGFLLTDKRPAAADFPPLPESALGWAKDFVQFDKNAESLTQVLSRCLISETFDEALKLRDYLAEHHARVVTLEGEWLDWTGACSAGPEASEAVSDLGLALQIENLQVTVATARADHETALEVFAECDREIETWKQKVKTASHDVAARRGEREAKLAESLKTETLMHSLAQREEAALSLIAESEEAERRLREDVDRLLSAIDESRSEINGIQKQIEALSERVWQARQENASTRDKYHESARALDAVLHRRELLSAEAARLAATESEQQESIKSNTEQGETSANVIRATETMLQETAQRLGQLFRTRDERYRAVDDAQRLKDAARGETSAMEEQLKRLRESREMAEGSLKKLELAIAKHEGELESLAAQAKSHFELELGRSTPPTNLNELRGLDVSQEMISEIRRKIENLGSVNLLAFEEYDAETARLDGMLANRADLLQAKATLEETIRKINETAEAKFLHTFEAVRANFQSLFSEFFPAGEADLILSGKDLLEADITMWANPSGKRLKSLTLMSGGEKTMTAIALLFSLYQVKPSPFCVLDEVDAPLDDANIDRFTRMIRRHSDHTQFIMITHNKRTMEVTDNLYGVTMQEEGVSKLVSVRLLGPAETQPIRAASAANG